MRKTKLKAAMPQHEIVYQELCELVAKHAGHLTAIEVLAVASNMVGKLIAMQDTRKVTVAQAMEIVIQNIEYGNHQMMGEIGETKGNA